jgi:quercetin dioxygenase-like cupin family protein
MREIRTFEMGYDEPATAWRADHALVVEVEQGTLWLTFEGDAEDYWVDSGQSFVLPAGMRAWIGAGRGDVRLTLSSASSRAKVGNDVSRAGPARTRSAIAHGLGSRGRQALA